MRPPIRWEKSESNTRGNVFIKKRNLSSFYLHDPVELLVRFPHESVQTVTVHVPRSGKVVDCVVQEGCPTGIQTDRVGIMIPGSVGSGISVCVGANIISLDGVGVRVRVSVGVRVLVRV